MRSVLVLVALIVAVAPAHAAYLCVDPSGTSGCHATIQAAIDAAVDGDSVFLPAGEIGEGNILISKSVSIIGAGAEHTYVSGAGVPGPVFVVRDEYVPGYPSIDVAFWNLTINGGNRGIDIGPRASVLIDHVRLVWNGPGKGAGFIVRGGKAVVNESLIFGNEATVEDPLCGGQNAAVVLCAVQQNPRNPLSNIYSSLEMYNSSVVSNLGGGVSGSSSRVDIHNSTFVGNVGRVPNPDTSSGNALDLSSSSGSITHTTFGYNPGDGRNISISNNQLHFVSNIVSTNAEGACYLSARRFSSDFNVFGDASCTGGNVIGANDIVADPQLRNYTYWWLGVAQEIDSSSPAVDRVPWSECWLPYDQAGRLRVGLGCDSGATEFQGR